MDLDDVACRPKFHVRFDDLGCREGHFCLKAKCPIQPVQIMGPGPAKGAQMTSKWTHQGARRSSRCVPLGHLFDQFLMKKEIREERARCGRVCMISIDFLDSPTLNPLAQAQSTHCFSILAFAPEKIIKSDELESIWDAFWFQFQDFRSLETLLVRCRCQGYGNYQNSAQTHIKPAAKVYL